MVLKILEEGVNLSKLVNRFRTTVYDVSASPIREFDAKTRDIPGIIKLTLGAPDFDTPDHIKEAAIQALHDGKTSYAPTPGLPHLLEAISGYLEKKYQLTYQPETEIIATIGASQALATALQAIINPGDIILIQGPDFSLYDTMIELAGGKIVTIDSTEDQFILNPDKLAHTLEQYGEQVKGIILNYPNNPTGATLTKEQAQAITSVLKKHDIFVISDEVYSELVYEGEHVSIASYLPQQTLLVNGVSKSHAMTGWRMGYLCAPAALMEHIVKVHQHMVTTTPTFVQEGVVEALTKGFDDAEAMKKEYLQRRNLVFERMTEYGFTIAKPNGAFYIFAKIPDHLNQDDVQFCLDLAQEGKVSLIPGSFFGEAGRGYVRVSYAASLENISEALNRIKDFVKK